MDSHSAPLWPPPAPHTPHDVPPVRRGAYRPPAAPTFHRDGSAAGGATTSLLLAAGEGLLSLAPSPPFNRLASVGEQHNGLEKASTFDMQGATLVGEHTVSALLARQPGLPMPLLVPRAEPPVVEWASPVAAACYARNPVQVHRGTRLHIQEMEQLGDSGTSGPFAQLVAAAHGHIRGADVRLGSAVLPVARKATAFSSDWKVAAQQQKQPPQRGYAGWPDQGWRQQEQQCYRDQRQEMRTPGSMRGDGLLGGDSNSFSSPSWPPEFHASVAASMITPEFSPSAWDDGEGGIQRGMSGDSDAFTSMASVSPHTSKSPPNEQSGHFAGPDTIDAGQDGEERISSSHLENASQTRWLSVSARVPAPIDLFATQSENKRHAEASLDIASRLTVDEELLQSLVRPMELNAVPRGPSTLQTASTPSYSAMSAHTTPTRLAPSKSVIVPGLSLNMAPQYRRLRLADILNSSEPQGDGNSTRRPRSQKAHKQGNGKKKQGARKLGVCASDVPSERLETKAVSKKRLISKTDAASTSKRPISRLSPTIGRVGGTVVRPSLSPGSLGYQALHSVIPRTQPSFPSVVAQKRPRGAAKPRPAKPAAAALKRKKIGASVLPQSASCKVNIEAPAQRAPSSLPGMSAAPPYSGTTATPFALGSSVKPTFTLKKMGLTGRTEASSHPGVTAKKRRRSEGVQTQRMKLAAQMMQDALRGLGAGDPAASALDTLQQHKVQDVSGPARNLALGELSLDRRDRGSKDVNGQLEHAHVETSATTAPAASPRLLEPSKFHLEVTAEAPICSQSGSPAKSKPNPSSGLGDVFDLGAVSAELPPAAVNSTVVVFCKRDFMRYQAAKLWRKYQEQEQKQEWRPVHVEGKRTRFRNPKYDVLVRKEKSRAPKASTSTHNGLTEYGLGAPGSSVDTNDDSPPALTECASSFQS